MYTCTIDFQMLLQINNILKENGYETTIHSINGCSHDSVELRDLDLKNREAILALIENFLKDKFLHLEEMPNDPTAFRVRSNFNK